MGDSTGEGSIGGCGDFFSSRAGRPLAAAGIGVGVEEVISVADFFCRRAGLPLGEDGGGVAIDDDSSSTADFCRRGGLPVELAVGVRGAVFVLDGEVQSGL